MTRSTETSLLCCVLLCFAALLAASLSGDESLHGAESQPSNPPADLLTLREWVSYPRTS
jgi:hypothetical protein